MQHLINRKTSSKKATPFLIEYVPSRCLVRWASSFEDIPAWDWTRGINPNKTWEHSEEGLAFYLAEFAKKRPDNATFLFPRLVRLTMHDNNREPIAKSILGEMLKIANASDFDIAVCKAVPRIGLLQGIGRISENSRQEWEMAVYEIVFWDSLLRFTLLKYKELPPWEKESRADFWKAFWLKVNLEIADYKDKHKAKTLEREKEAHWEFLETYDLEFNEEFFDFENDQRALEKEEAIKSDWNFLESFWLLFSHLLDCGDDA